ncbi:MarR family transcriptional regulator [Amnibacterium setariae]|uniref:MarR family transcriptional regulator n=1 Tax=Amnibacterium setariae TaxID=2306585 RepID=A0A3A1U127_9MICO|nr:MarR family transcriptional regulator [Amnibacterium setariae]RIX30221.1 MarR family transcriptional regulator [Amnibacterium setariae]
MLASPTLARPTYTFVGATNRYGVSMSETGAEAGPPRRLRQLVSWQANKVGTIGSRLTLQRMTAAERGDYAVLAALDEFGDLSQAEIGRRLGLDRNDVNAVATRLDGARHVDRRTDPADRRRKVLTLTPSGRAHLGGLQAHAAAVQEALLAGLTSEQQEQLVGLLGLVLKAHGPQSA